MQPFWWDEKKKDRAYILILVFAAGLYFFLAANYLLHYQPEPLAGDALGYHNMAIQLLQKGVYGYRSTRSNAYVTPGYPLFLAVIYFLAGVSPEVVRWVQVLLGTGTVVLVGGIGRRVTDSRTVGAISALGAALYPSFIWAPSVLLTEVLFNFLFSLYLWIQLRVLSRQDSVAHIVAGALMGMAVLVRPHVAPLLVIPYFFLFLRIRSKRSMFLFLSAIVGFCAVMSPWWIRNLVVLHRWIFLAEGGGNPLLAGSFPWQVDFTYYIFPQGIDQGELAKARILWGFVHDFERYFLWYTVGHFVYTFGQIWMGVSVEQTYLQPLFKLHYLYILGGFIGWGIALFRNFSSQIYAVLFFAGVFLQLLFLPTYRYAYPWMIFFVVFTSLCALVVARRVIEPMQELVGLYRRKISGS